MKANLLFVGVTLSLAACFAIYMLIVAYKYHSVWANAEKPLWKSCEPCTGCGVVMLDGEPIPLEYRTYYRTMSNTAKRHGVIQGPIGNTRTCLDCRGVGHFWVYKDEVRTGIPTANPFERLD